MHVIKETTYRCGVCKFTYLDRKLAEECCAQKFCEDCGKELRPRWHSNICEPCRIERLFTKAKKLTPEQWDGWVQKDGYGYNEGYFESVDDLLECCKDEGIEPPDWVFCCGSIDHKLDADNILDDMLVDAYEDAREALVDEEELYQFIEAWNAKQKVATYYLDYTKVVVLK